MGLEHVVVCPGSRSGPLAVAAALLEPQGLRLHTALDERSAAFFALGLGRALGHPAAVLTTSGSAVAQLLPACVEADHGTLPLLLITADRPDRLKGCGANQSVNQETFLRNSCRAFLQGAGTGLAGMAPPALEALAREALAPCLGRFGGPPPGAVHLNLPLEEPLHADAATLAAVSAERADVCGALNEGNGEWAEGNGERAQANVLKAQDPLSAPLALDPDQPGVVVAGPWRGRPQQWPAHRAALVRWQRRSGWPVLADGLSGLRGDPELEVVAGYDLLLEPSPSALAPLQVLRLGSLPASRRLERWLAGLAGRQVLVSEGDPRPLDPLGRVEGQGAMGLAAWLAALERGAPASGSPSSASRALAQAWRQAEAGVQQLLEQELNPPPAAARDNGNGNGNNNDAPAWSEPALARCLARLLPEGLPLMLANSSPVRDWESFSAGHGPGRPVLGFRGASGIDGTLSQACGLAEGLGACVLLSGDLALLHDSNGWLWRRQLRGRLTVVLIDNEGGGIFEQLPIRCPPGAGLDFERLFAMPQPVDPLALAAVHGIPARDVPGPAQLPALLAWALEQPFSLLRVRTDRQRDAALRRRLRTMAGEPSGL